MATGTFIMSQCIIETYQILLTELHILAQCLLIIKPSKSICSVLNVKIHQPTVSLSKKSSGSVVNINIFEVLYSISIVLVETEKR
jgi:hypothetical protein